MNAKINILSLELQDFKNKENGTVNTMTKITYAIPLKKSGNFVGLSVMTSYGNTKCFQGLSRIINKEVEANIELQQGEKSNSVKYVITHINGEPVK